VRNGEPQETCERLFETFLAPLVVGGPMHPRRPIGGKRALAIGDHRAPSNAPLLSLTELARVRVARKLAPIDTLDPTPTGNEWALGAVLHDLVQATHPGFDAAFRRSGPRRILDVIEKTIERIREPATIGDALSRHSWFSRMFELARTDTELKWWTGSERFLGTDPPKRLTAWPELRRVTQTRTPRPLMELPTSGAAVDVQRFVWTVEAILRKTPLTDLATIDRLSPAFAWTHENLALVATRAGRTMAMRALAALPRRAVDAALGRATKHLFAVKAPRALAVAVDLLRDRALEAASARLGGHEDADPFGADQNDAAFAISAGAIVASQWIARTGGGFSDADRRALLQVLAPAAASKAAKEVRALLGG
jgi:hypothetical protein